MKLETGCKLKDMQEQYGNGTETQQEDILHNTPKTPDNMAENQDKEELVENDSSVVLKSTCKHDIEPYNITSEDEKQRQQEGQKIHRYSINRRRQHHNVDDLIKELASLLPSTNQPDTTVNEDSILTAAVRYIKYLQKDRQRLQTLETCRSRMNSLNKTLLTRIVQLELKLQSSKLFSNRTLRSTLEEKLNRMVDRFSKAGFQKARRI